MAGLHVALFAALLFTMVLHGYGRKHVISKEKDLELDKKLNIISKHALKTFKTEYGDIIDCVDIYKQPAFDHPLLKNHIIQRKPSSTPPVVKQEAPPRAKHVKVSGSYGCPSGSVPIRRTTNVGTNGSKLLNVVNHNASPVDKPYSHYSYVKIANHPGGILHGARADIDAYNPTVEHGQSSAAQIWIQAGSTWNITSIEVGWVVDPDLYGDKNTRFFTYWTADGYKNTGCYDIRCPGFVQINKEFTLGDVLSNTSTVNGEQYALLVFVYQDQITKNWWLMATDDNIYVGYWPKEIFPRLAIGANNIIYGGRAQGIVNHLSPPMGSGLKPDHSSRSFYRACFFDHVQFVNPARQLESPSDYFTSRSNDRPDCYGLDNHGSNEPMGYTILFGGPGGRCGG